MIQKWEIVPEANDIFPDRCRVNVTASEDALNAIQSHFVNKVGKPWVPKKSEYAHCFYIYEFTPEDRALLENFLNNKGAIPPSPPVNGAAAPPQQAATPPPPVPSPEVVPMPTQKFDETLRSAPAEKAPAAASNQEDISAYFGNQEINLDAPPGEPDPLEKFAPKKKGQLKKSGDKKKKSYFETEEGEAGGEDVQSSSEALMDFFGGAPAKPAAEDKAEEADPDETIRMEPPKKSQSAGGAVEDFGNSGAGGPREKSREDGPMEAPPGYKLYQIGYLVPDDMSSVGDAVHEVLTETLESRRMPFLFRRAMTAFYQWPDKSLLENVINDAVKKKVEILICIGEEQKLEVLTDLCNSRNIKHFYLSREEARKKYWRLGMVTRIVL